MCDIFQTYCLRKLTALGIFCYNYSKKPSLDDSLIIEYLYNLSSKPGQFWEKRKHYHISTSINKVTWGHLLSLLRRHRCSFSNRLNGMCWMEHRAFQGGGGTDRDWSWGCRGTKSKFSGRRGCPRTVRVGGGLRKAAGRAANSSRQWWRWEMYLGLPLLCWPSLSPVFQWSHVLTSDIGPPCECPWPLLVKRPIAKTNKQLQGLWEKRMPFHPGIAK